MQSARRFLLGVVLSVLVFSATAAPRATASHILVKTEELALQVRKSTHEHTKHCRLRQPALPAPNATLPRAAPLTLRAARDTLPAPLSTAPLDVSLSFPSTDLKARIYNSSANPNSNSNSFPSTATSRRSSTAGLTFPPLLRSTPRALPASGAARSDPSAPARW